MHEGEVAVTLREDGRWQVIREVVFARPDEGAAPRPAG